jgi:DNA invertase Pin-like site-specific DNA recombinase
MKAFAYFRTSSATNVGSDKDSLARQTSAVEAYAAAQGIEIVQSFYDAAVSGADAIDARPGFAAMLEAIAGNGVRQILVETANRFARDLIVQETGHKYLKQQGIELIAVDSPTSFLDDTPTAIMVRQILGAVSEFEKASLVAKLAAARKRLGKPGGRKGLGVLRPAVVERAHALRAGDPGMALRSIAVALASEGFVSSAGTPYGPKAVASMLRQAV